jgi:hypothetical protein
MLLFPYRLKNLVTGLVALVLILTLVPDSFSSEWYAGPIMGALVVILDGVLWGQKSWDIHPVIPMCAISLLAFTYYVFERDHKLESLLPISLGFIGMHTLLYALGKLDSKSA